MKRARLLDLGRRPYREVLALQREIHGRVARGEEDDTWIVVEHDPVITLGRKAKHDNILLSADALGARGIDVVEVERGGDVTYHGPGQVVVYPIVRLPRFREVVPFVSALEAAVIDALSTFGIVAHRRPEHRGVYVGNNAICAIGLAVKQMATLHGLALNVATELDYDRLISPCGTQNLGITSILRECGSSVTFQEVQESLYRAVECEFTLDFQRQASNEQHFSISDSIVEDATAPKALHNVAEMSWEGELSR